MSNDRKLLNLINYAENFPINDMPGFTSIMSIHYHYVRVSENYLLLGHTLLNDFNRAEQSKMPCHTSGHDELVLQPSHGTANNEIKFLNYTYFDKWKIFLGHKKAIVLNNEVIGVLTNFMDITNSGIIEPGRFLLNKEQKTNKQQINFLIQPMNHHHHLTQREQECLFFLMRGHNYSKIAKNLNIAITTIQTHIEHIKKKFHVYNRAQIIEKAISLGFMSTIPESLLSASLD